MVWRRRSLDPRHEAWGWRWGMRDRGASEEGWRIGWSGAGEVGTKGDGDAVGVQGAVLGQEVEEQFREPMEGDAVALAGLLIKPIAPLHESVKGGGTVGPDQLGGMDEAATVVHQIPVTREAA